MLCVEVPDGSWKESQHLALVKALFNEMLMPVKVLI